MIARACERIREMKIPGYGDDEVSLMAETMEGWRPTHVFEWGTNRGSSARIWFELARLGGFDCQVHTVELPPGLSHFSPEHPGDGHAFFVHGLESVHTHWGDGVMVALALYAGLQPERALFFVDGDHSREAVARELRLIAPTVVRARTVLLFHDTYHPEGRGPTGPAEALAEFLVDRSHDYDVTVLQSQAGMTRLWPRA